MDGKPLEGAVVTFNPTGGGAEGSGGGASGRTDAQGKYTLRSIVDDKSGASVGKHRVTISLFENDSKNPDVGGKEKVPLRFNHKSELTFDVPAGGSDKANFDLQSK